MAHESPTVAAKAIKNIVVRWADIWRRALGWLASASCRVLADEKTRGFPESEHVGDVTNMFLERPISARNDLITSRVVRLGGRDYQIQFSCDEAFPDLCPNEYLWRIIPSQNGQGSFRLVDITADASDSVSPQHLPSLQTLAAEESPEASALPH